MNNPEDTRPGSGMTPRTAESGAPDTGMGPTDYAKGVDTKGTAGYTPGTGDAIDLSGNMETQGRASTMPGQRRQYTEGQGREPEHTHPAMTHTHDHYHVSHHHGGTLSEWQHRTTWHTHEHNHAETTHSHDHSQEEEAQHHAKEAHMHDHTSPAQSPA